MLGLSIYINVIDLNHILVSSLSSLFMCFTFFFLRFSNNNKNKKIIFKRKKINSRFLNHLFLVCQTNRKTHIDEEKCRASRNISFMKTYVQYTVYVLLYNIQYILH